MSRTTLLMCVAFVVLVMTVGCERKQAKREANRTRVTGIVNIDGKPLSGGTITFTSVADKINRVAIPIKPDGTFATSDAPLGDVLVSVESESMKSMNPAAYMPIPRKYSDIKTSGLKATITKGDPEGQKLPPFELKSK